LQGDVTLPPLNGGLMGQTAETDKTMLHECKVFGTSAAAILCIGTCSSFGGIPAAAGNRTGASGALYKGLAKPGKYNGVLNQFAAKIRNIGGCPPHSDWIVGTIAYIIATNYQLPPTEAYGRPIDYYGQYQCNAGPCEWRYNQGYVDADETSYDNPKLNTAGAPGTNAFISSSKLYLQKWANSAETATLGKRAVGCIGVLGCKGRKTKADCSLRRWNADQPGHYGTGWCVASGAGCHGCTEPTFPDKVGKFFNFA
jgi:hydrogenase small subunit